MKNYKKIIDTIRLLDNSKMNIDITELLEFIKSQVVADTKSKLIIASKLSQASTLEHNALILANADEKRIDKAYGKVKKADKTLDAIKDFASSICDYYNVQELSEIDCKDVESNIIYSLILAIYFGIGNVGDTQVLSNICNYALSYNHVYYASNKNIKDDKVKEAFKTFESAVKTYFSDTLGKNTYFNNAETCILLDILTGIKVSQVKIESLYTWRITSVNASKDKLYKCILAKMQGVKLTSLYKK